MSSSQDVIDAINTYAERRGQTAPEAAISTLEEAIALCQEHIEYIREEYMNEENSEDDEDEDDTFIGDHP